MQQEQRNNGFGALISNYINSLDAEAREQNRLREQDGRSPITRFYENLLFGTPEYEGAETSIVDSLVTGPVQGATHGGKRMVEGYQEGKPMKAVGGLGLMAASASPFASKLAAPLFSTIPRSVATGTALTASPLLAEEAFTPSQAYAEGETSFSDELQSKAKTFGLPILASIAGGAGFSVLIKNAMKRAALKRQQKLSDINQVSNNRAIMKEVEKASNNSDIPLLREKLSVDAKSTEPQYYSVLTEAGLDNEYSKAAKAQKFLVDHMDKIGAGVGAATSGGLNYYLSDGEASAGELVSSTIGGLMAGGRVQSTIPGSRTPVLKSKVDKFDVEESARKHGAEYGHTPEDTQTKSLHDSKELESILNEIKSQKPSKARRLRPRHPIDRKAAVLEGLNEGKSVKEMARLHNVKESTVYRWRRLENKRDD